MILEWRTIGLLLLLVNKITSVARSWNKSVEKLTYSQLLLVEIILIVGY